MKIYCMNHERNHKQYRREQNLQPICWVMSACKGTVTSQFDLNSILNVRPSVGGKSSLRKWVIFVISPTPHE